MFAAKEDKWRKACKLMSVDTLRAEIRQLTAEQDQLIGWGVLSSTAELNERTRKIEIATRVLGQKERGGFVSR